MRVLRAIVWVVALSWIAGIGQEARGGMTIDVVFKDPTVGGVLYVDPGDPGAPGCVGPWGYTVATSGRCMDVVLKSDHDFVGVKVSVAYDGSNGLSFVQAREWLGIGMSWNFSVKGVPPWGPQRSCYPSGGPGITDVGPGLLQDFDCAVDTPNNPPVAPAGTYRLGTVVWDASGVTGASLISAVFASGDGVLPVINGNIILDYSSKVVLGSKILMIPEPGTAALLGLGFAGLMLAARRRRG